MPTGYTSDIEEGITFKQFAEDVKRHNEKNTWVKLLHKSLKDYK